MVFQLFAKRKPAVDSQAPSLESGVKHPRAVPKVQEVSVEFKKGKFRGRQQALILERRQLQDKLKMSKLSTASEELAALQGEWQGGTVGRPLRKSYFVRGTTVEERSGGSRKFSSLRSCERVLAHVFAEQPGPQKSAFAEHRGLHRGHWQWRHQSAKVVFWSLSMQHGESVHWLHADEEVVWSRGGPAVEELRVRYIKDGHEEHLLRHAGDAAGIWRAQKGFLVSLSGFADEGLGDLLRPSRKRKLLSAAKFLVKVGRRRTVDMFD